MSIDRRRPPLLLVVAALASAIACASGGGIRPGKPPAECAQFELPLPAGVTAPRLLSRAQPRPPFDRSRAGYVCVQATITAQGQVAGVEVVSTDNPAFAQAFVSALAQWRFEPPMRDGAPTELRSAFSASFVR